MNRLLMRVRKGPEANIRKTPQVQIPIKLFDDFFADVIFNKENGEPREAGKYFFKPSSSVPSNVVGKLHNIKFPIPEIRDLQEPVLLFEKIDDRIFYECYDGGAYYQTLYDGLNSGFTKKSIGNPEKATWWRFLDQIQIVTNTPRIASKPKRKKDKKSLRGNNFQSDSRLFEIKKKRKEVLQELQNSQVDHKEGFVYIISHSYHTGQKGYVSIGRACDYESRQTSYNRADPDREYVLECVRYFPDRFLAESLIHNELAAVRQGNTEWFKIAVPDAIKVLMSL